MAENSEFIEPVGEFKEQLIPPMDALLQSEMNYLLSLDQIVNGYMAEYKNENSKISVPKRLKGCKDDLFANINDIYEWHKNYFLKALIARKHSLTEVGELFAQNEHKFKMYAKYCDNKPLSNYLLKKNKRYFAMVKMKLGHKKDLNDLLITPVLHLCVYHRLLFDIVKLIRRNNQTEHLESMTAACDMIQNVFEYVNNSNALEETNSGKLLFHDYLNCEYDGKEHKQYVLLYQHLIIFTTKKEPEKINYEIPTLHRYCQIPLNKLRLTHLLDNTFLIRSTDPNSTDRRIVCKADTIEKHQQWIIAITNQLSEI